MREVGEVEDVKGSTPRWSLLLWVQLAAVVGVLEHWERKSPAGGWQRAPGARTRYFDEALQRLVAWHSGERADAESGLSHLAHAICCLLFLAWFDDQAVAPSSPEEAPAAPAARALPERPVPTAESSAVGRGDDVVGPPPRGFEYLDPEPRGVALSSILEKMSRTAVGLELEQWGEFFSWSKRFGADWRRALAECEDRGWLSLLCGALYAGRHLKHEVLVVTACACARSVLHLVPAGEDRPRLALEAAERWTRGEATVEEVRMALAGADAVWRDARARHAKLQATDSVVRASEAVVHATFAIGDTHPVRCLGMAAYSAEVARRRVGDDVRSEILAIVKTELVPAMVDGLASYASAMAPRGGSPAESAEEAAPAQETPPDAAAEAPAGSCPEPFSQEWAEELILKATPGAGAPEPAPEASADAMGTAWRVRLIELGKSKGHLTYGEIIEALPEDSSSDQIDEIVGTLGDEGIELVDAPLRAKVSPERAVEEPAAVEPPAGPPPVMRPRCRPTLRDLLDSFPRGLADGESEREIRLWVGPYLPDWKTAIEQCDRCDYLFWLGSRLLVCGALRRQDFVLAMCACVRVALACSREGADAPSRALEAAERWARGEVGLDVVKSAASAAAELAKQSLSTGSFYSLCWACADAADGCDSLFLDGGHAPATPALVAANVIEDCGVSPDMVSIVRRTFVPALVAAIDSYLNATYEGVPDA